MHNVRKEVDLIHPDTGDSMELDIYIKSLNLAFEYQVRILSLHLYSKKCICNRKHITTKVPSFSILHRRLYLKGTESKRSWLRPKVSLW